MDKFDRSFDRPDGSPIDAAVTMSHLLGVSPKFKDGYPVIDEEALMARLTSGVGESINIVFDPLRESNGTEEIVCDEAAE